MRYVSIHRKQLESIRLSIDRPTTSSTALALADVDASIQGKKAGTLKVFCDLVAKPLSEAHLTLQQTRLSMVKDDYKAEDLDNDEDPVANVSPREARLWCQLNTHEFHHKLNAANGNGELLEFMSKS
ncbi:hypothetical protein EDB81DRAFT_764359 [Dactylonectria macrodidyma]|uniref:Uncharacterized protein n=1 Tax=Dactylonectria macrodidyma TaxID=307937 RepID=A0A9P9E214_9HYPO|nr:hypothetical protein EDB81DRAFT_764359 [Dactylonectria macrodidyma]